MSLSPWAMDTRIQRLPISTTTIKAVTDVQAFALLPDDLKFVVSQFGLHHSILLKNTFRYFSLRWRTWAACFIQAAWRRHSKRKLEKILEEENRRLLDALAARRETSPLSIGASLYATRFSTNALRITRRKIIDNAQISAPKSELLLQKPSNHDFDDNDDAIILPPDQKWHKWSIYNDFYH